jgi:sarcosine oxidase subunit alpha
MIAASGPEVQLEIRAAAVVAATGSYERVPLVPGNDRPGVMAARIVTHLLDWYGILPGERALLVGDGDELAAAEERLSRAGAMIFGPVPTASLQRVLGRRHVTAVVCRERGRQRRERVDLVVFGDRSPNLDLALAAGAAVESIGGVLAPVCDRTGRTSVASLFVVGSAAGRPGTGLPDEDRSRLAGRSAAAHALGRAADPDSPNAAREAGPGRPGIPGLTDGSATTSTLGIDPNALVCFCEDVRVWEMRAEQAAGYQDPELVKRRTGALTGPCQGKYCLAAFACLAGRADRPVAVPTSRPPLRPVRLGDLVLAEADVPDTAG